MITLSGHLEKITYFNEKNHYTIARFRADEINTSITIIGFVAGVNIGETLKIKGSWETHPKYGEQFKVGTYEVTLPATVKGISQYLKSGVIKGIGPVLAERLVGYFKEDTLKVIEKDPDRLLEVNGIGKAKAALICNAYKDHHPLRHLMQFLYKLGINASFGAKIINEFGDDAVDIICKNPYRIANIPGIGFNAADTLAIKLGVSCDSPERIKASIHFIIEQSAAWGDIFVYYDRLIEECYKLISVENKAIQNILEQLVNSKQLVIENVLGKPGEKAVYSKMFYEAETGTANKLKALLSVPVAQYGLDHKQITHEVLIKLAIKPSVEQIRILEKIFTKRVAIITGGPGTGKTTLIRAICAIFETLGKKVVLSAPTGRAARRISEITQRNAATIHKLLGYNPTNGLFDKNQDNPLDTDVLIIDEASMVDTLLMFHLMKAVAINSVLIMVGDVYQLPSVGPGNLLSDMINAKIIPTFELSGIFRQAKKSAIVLNAHKVRQGKKPVLSGNDPSDRLSDFYFIEKSDPKKIVETIVELCKTRISKRYLLDSIRDIQVLTPMHKGEVGSINLNRALQEGLNTNSGSIEGRIGIFRTGDKVMHLKNNYEKDIYNGEIGIIGLIDNAKRQLTVEYYDRSISYDFSELDEITLAYAISVHKSQGSEYPAVIVPVTTQHFVMLQRNLLYTAITRGTKLVVLIGTKKALYIALKNDKPQKRLSSLVQRLIV